MVLNDGLRFTPISKTTLSAGQVQLPGPELQVCTKVDLVRDQSIQWPSGIGLGPLRRLVPHPGAQGHVCGEILLSHPWCNCYFEHSQISVCRRPCVFLTLPCELQRLSGRPDHSQTVQETTDAVGVNVRVRDSQLHFN